MVVPSSHREPLTSRYNDPNHPANSGSLISLLSGGVINPAPRRAETRTARRQRLDSRREARDVRRVARGRTPRGPLRDRGQRRSQRQRQPMIKKVLQQDVLYLLIVNLPSQEEIQESVSRLEHLVREESG